MDEVGSCRVVSVGRSVVANAIQRNNAKNSVQIRVNK